MKDLLLIVPSRSREGRIDLFKQHFDKNSTISDLCIGIDNDQHERYPSFDGFVYDVNENMQLGPKLNMLSKKYCDDYKYIAFMGDDHLIQTYGWDEKLISCIDGMKYGMSYGNDLVRGEELPTAILMNSNIIKKLGYMCPPTLVHLYLDNFWLTLGQTLGTIRYCPDVIIEHMHFTTGKSEIDQTYIESNTPELYRADEAAYNQYLKVNFQNDLKKLT